MKSLAFVLFAWSAVTVQGRQDSDVTPDDLAKYTVILGKSVASADNNGADNFIIRNVDGKEVRDVAKFRFGKDEAGQTKIYTLIQPGRHDVTLRYHGVRKHLLGNESFDAEVTHQVKLMPGLYEMRGEREAEFAFIWMIQTASGDIIAPRTKCLVRKSKSAIPVVIPIPIR